MNNFNKWDSCGEIDKFLERHYQNSFKKIPPKIPIIIKLILYLKTFLQRKLGSNVFIEEFYQTFKGGIPNRRQWKRGDSSQLVLQNNYPDTKNKDCKKTKL